MKRIICLFIFLISTVYGAECQITNSSVNDYKTGVDYLQNNNYQLADSFLTKYLNSLNVIFGLNSSIPIKDAYFNLGVAKLGLGDTSSFCSNIYNASLYNDNDAFNFYCSTCITKFDSVFYNKKYKLCNKKESRYIVVNYFDRYKKQTMGRVIDSKISGIGSGISLFDGGNIIGLYYVENNDTIFNNLNYDCMPKFKLWYKDFYSFVGERIQYPENKDLAYSIYKKDEISIDVDVLIDEKGMIKVIDLERFYPENIDEKYKQEALRLVNELSEFLIPGKMLGRNIKSRILIPVVFKLKE